MFKFNEHYHLEGKHAELSPSGYHWLNYDAQKMRTSYENSMKKQEGTYLHDLASRLIKTHTKVATMKKSFNQFVNDAIKMNMSSEVMLYYSDNCFGTADAILYDEHERHLQIHDLKTGLSKPSFKQLNIYAALFCLEYGINPHLLTFETRLYQTMGYMIEHPNPEVIVSVMHKIEELDLVLNEVKQNYGGIFHE